MRDATGPQAVATGAGQVAVSAVETPFGQFVIATVDGTAIASRGPRDEALDPLAWARWLWTEEAVVAAGSEHDAAHAEVREYFAGRRQRFDLPLALDGNALHVRAWLAATEVPYGRSITYGDLAWEVGAPGAARAMGRAMTLCPLPLFIPCHRVVRAGGKRCGQLEAWERRRQLLDFEREQLGLAPHGARAVDRRRGDRLA